MKKRMTLTLLALGAGVCANAATLTHRYDFHNDADDAIGTLTGTLSADNASTNIEAPLFQVDVPDDADTSFASNSIEFGMTVGTKASYVNFGNGVETDIYNDKSGSVAYWFKADALSGDMFSNVPSHRTILQSNGNIRLAGTVNENFSFTGGVTAGTWHHFALTWNDDAGAGTIALDGVVQAYSFTSGALSDPSRLMVGNFANNDSQLATQFDGHIYDLQIYEGVLTNGEISTLAGNAGTAIPELDSYALIGGCLALASVMLRRRRS